MGVGFSPDGAALQGAIAWLAAQPARDHARIEEASQRFGLSPLESAVLFRYFSPVTPPFEDRDQ